ncbi:MAG: helix-turn-helix domain-containing protein [Flavobacteriales bacterium]
MSFAFLTSLTEEEFKKFLKNALQEIITENLSIVKNQVPDVLNIREAANFLKLKITTLYEKTSRKLIPHFKKGNKLYFNRQELQQWITGGKVKTQEELSHEAITYLNTR